MSEAGVDGVLLKQKLPEFEGTNSNEKALKHAHARRTRTYMYMYMYMRLATHHVPVGYYGYGRPHKPLIGVQLA